jgi:hypothetical protein
MGIIRAILPRPHWHPPHGYPPEPLHAGHRRQLLLPTLNTEEMVIFLVDKEKEEKPPKVLVQLDVLVP